MTTLATPAAALHPPVLQDAWPEAREHRKAQSTTEAAPGSFPLAQPGRGFALIMLLLALIWFGGLEYRGLFRPDEGRYAEIPREMLASGDWITPRLNGLKYFEKPPLQYWATAGTYVLFGFDEWTTRFWPALAGFFGLSLIALAGARLSPPRSGLLPALMLAGTWGYFVAAQFVTLDMSVTFFLTGTLAGFILAQRPGLGSGAQRAWMLVAWAAMALAVLSKGLIGIVLPVLALSLYVAVERDRSVLRRLHALPGLAVFLLIVLPWFVLVQEKNPEFWRFFFVREHFERYMLAT